MDKKKIEETVNKAKSEGAKMEKAALAELKKIHKQMEAASKKVGNYVKKNPEKAAMISAGIGAALGAVTAILISGRGKKKK